MQYSEHTVRAADGTELHVDVWRPDGPPQRVVVVAHGGAEHSGRYAQLAGELVEAGALVFGPDHRGLGRSGGRRGDVVRFEDYADDLLRVMRDQAGRLPEEQRPQHLPWFLFGHSMGGLIALVYLLDHERDLQLRGAIVSSPLLGLAMKVNPLKLAAGKLAARLAPKLALPSGIPADAVSRDAEVVRRYEQDPLRVGVVTAGWFAAMNAAIARVEREASRIRMPCLWYCGTGDRIVDHTAVQRIFAGIEGAAGRDQTLRSFEGYYHELHNEPPALRQPIVEMITGWLATHGG
ncbi:MAG: lysophospholipase [Nannocystaceae bacterium]|nr:lysophospholipase [Nannocystaceae bacterium]